ncbi:scrFIAM [Symbiodinium sp. CCMP2592]|nr:scrFIAM [Symbiodinium sp. CCMP2592]CAE7708077.1 scrFIAM [Symbiodinium sp. CCMP2592]
MKEGCLPVCKLIPDIVGYTPSGRAASAEALLCGFPCQGVSQAGDQRGLNDDRSGLIKEAFRVYDTLGNGKVMLIENVGALLHKTPACRKLVSYILQAVGSSSLQCTTACHTNFDVVFQACKKRGLTVLWCCVTLANVGLSVATSGFKLGLCFRQCCQIKTKPCIILGHSPAGVYAGDQDGRGPRLYQGAERISDNKLYAEEPRCNMLFL